MRLCPRINVRASGALVAGVLSASRRAPIAAGGRHASLPGPGRIAERVRQPRQDSDRELTRRAATPSTDTRQRDRDIADGQLPPNSSHSSRAAAQARDHQRLRDRGAESALKTLAANPNIVQFHVDRPLFKQNLRRRSRPARGALQQALGITGAGIGVAVIDSGVATWHDDLTKAARPSHIRMATSAFPRSWTS